METIEKIYFYKMTTDNGGAPCPYKSVLTLAICKPKIRATAKKNDWIIGFGGNNLDERLIYVAQVKEILLNGEYFKNKKYRERPDCIYRWDDSAQKYYWKHGKKYHTDGLNLDHDLDNGKALVLLSEKYTYFGKQGTSEYKERYLQLGQCIESLRKGHRVNHSETLFSELRKLIKESIKLKTDGKPSHSDSCRTCNDIDGDIIVSSCKFTKYI